MKIICIVQNFADHNIRNSVTLPDRPLFFLKPDSAVVHRNRPFFIPDFSDNIQYEVGLLVKISKLGKCINEKFAHTYYNEIGLGVNFIARDLQQEAIRKGEPWEIAATFDYSAIVSPFVTKDKFPDIHNIHFSLFKNEERVQYGNSNQMIFSIDQIICHVSKFMTLKIGDILFTGTPAGTGRVNINDRLCGFIEEEQFLRFRIK